MPCAAAETLKVPTGALPADPLPFSAFAERGALPSAGHSRLGQA